MKLRDNPLSPASPSGRALREACLWDGMGYHGPIWASTGKHEKSWCCRELTGVNYSTYPQPTRQPSLVGATGLTPTAVPKAPCFADSSAGKSDYPQLSG